MLIAAGLAPAAALAQSSGCAAVNDGLLNFNANFASGTAQPGTTSGVSSGIVAISMMRMTTSYNDNVVGASGYVADDSTTYSFVTGDRLDFNATVSNYTSGTIRLRFRNSTSPFYLTTASGGRKDATANGVYSGTYTIAAGISAIGMAADQSLGTSSVSISVSCTPFVEAGLTLGVSMSHSGTPAQGGTVDYTITPSASGAATGSNLTLTFSLPSGLSYNSGSGSGWSCTSTRCIYSNTIANGASGNPLTLRADVAANAAASLTPSVTLSGGNAGSSANASDPTTISATGGNGAPTDIGISLSSVNENVAGNSTVGTLSSTDPDAGDTFTYSLVAGAGDTDNAAFNINGSNLRISASPDFETQSSYSVRVRSTDAGGLFFEKAFTITVNNENEAPADINLSASAINENVAANATVGVLSSADPDIGDTFTYSLVAGAGSTDNAAFTISGSNLRISASPDFETKSSYSVRVRSTDAGGLFFEKAFTITVNNVNEAPTDINLSASAMNENVAANSTVGVLSSTDPDAGDTFTYALVAGTGSTDNAAFNISGGNLRISAIPDFETKSSYSVRVRSTDAGGLFFEKAFTITVNNVNEVPSAGSVAVTGTVQVGLSLTGAYVYSDPENDAEGTSTFRWVRNSVNTGITGGSDVATTLSYTPVVGDQGQYLYFCVTPVASAGATTGVLTCSVATAQVPTSTNGACATSSVAVVSAPVGIAACIAGTVTTPAATAGQFTWGCAGSGGGTSTAAAACSVPRGYNVTPSAGAHGAITPNTVQVVGYNSSTTFTVTPDSGFVPNVTGTCGGNLSGATYTTNVITGACTVNAAFTPTTSMANIPTRQGGVTATLSAVGCTAVDAAAFVDAPAAGKPADKSFPYGLIDFTLTGCVGSADVTITYSEAIPSDATYYKELAGVYSVLPATISGNTVRFTLADNGAADADAAMGTIRDPSGLALGAGPAAIPTLSEWGLILLAALMVGFGLLAARRRTIQRA